MSITAQKPKQTNKNCEYVSIFCLTRKVSRSGVAKGNNSVLLNTAKPDKAQQSLTKPDKVTQSHVKSNLKKRVYNDETIKVGKGVIFNILFIVDLNDRQLGDSFDFKQKYQVFINYDNVML